jgi:NAD(P)-dependent dehydrogenase (short-subunit alcohol dehydrogenase family)
LQRASTKLIKFYNQIVVNTCNLFPYAEPSHTKLVSDKIAYLFINDNTALKLFNNSYTTLAEVKKSIDENEVKKLFAALAAKFGRIDLLFNNAGLGTPAMPMEDISYEQWMSVVNTNLSGAFLCSQEAIRMMKAQSPQGGRIINNGSISAHAPRPFSAPYTATKHAMTGLTKAISLDGRNHHIVCGQIDIGNAATEMTERMAKGIIQADGSSKIEPRMDVDHVGQAVLHMAQLPLESNVLFMTIMANNMPFVGRG